MFMASLIGAAVASKKWLQDLVLWELETRYNRRKVVLTGVAAAGSVEYPIGRILKLGAGGEGTALGVVAGNTAVARYILAERVVLLNAATAEVKVIKRGPCIINENELVHVSGETAPNIAAQLAQLRDVWGIEFVKEPVVQSNGSMD